MAATTMTHHTLVGAIGTHVRPSRASGTVKARQYARYKGVASVLVLGGCPLGVAAAIAAHHTPTGGINRNNTTIGVINRTNTHPMSGAPKDGL